MLIAKKRDWIEVLLHAVFWTGVFFTLDSFADSHSSFVVERNGLVMNGLAVHRVSPYPFFTLALLMLLFYGNIYWLFKKMPAFSTSAAKLAITAGWFTLIFATNYFAVQRMLMRPKQAAARQPAKWLMLPSTGTLTGTAPANTHVPPLPPAVGAVQLPPPPPQFTTDEAVWPQSQFTMLLISLSVLGVSLAYFFLKQWGRAEYMRNQLAAQQLDTEIKLLKSQINPHFFFNTLNNLYSMAQARGNDELADGISKLSGMMRYMIYESNESGVPLQKEIEYLQHYIALNKLRYADDEIKLLLHYPNETGGVFIAPMLFIPFVENAFKHGVRIGQQCTIEITILLKETQLLFYCKNPVHSVITGTGGETSGIGLENVKRRLQLVYPGRHTLLIDDKDGQFTVNLEINVG